MREEKKSIRIELEPQYRQALSVVHPTVALLALYGNTGRLEMRNNNTQYSIVINTMSCLSGVVTSEGYADPNDNIGNIPFLIKKLRKLAEEYGGAEPMRQYWNYNDIDYTETYDIKPFGVSIFAPEQFWKCCYFITTMILEDIEDGKTKPEDINDIFVVLEFINECARIWDTANESDMSYASKEGAAALAAIAERCYIAYTTLKSGTISQTAAYIQSSATQPEDPLTDIPW